MCGITGFTNLNTHLSADKATRTLSDMTDCLSHRGPDAGGAWISADNQIALGHRRLSIIDLNPTGAQPMSTEDKRYTIVFNGEIYNYLDLEQSLQTHGITCEGTSDTRVLIEHIAHFGLEKTLPLLNGMFAFALWDEKTKTLSLARDRIGQKPLYYAIFNQQLIFASELKSLERHPAFDTKICPRAVSAFLRFGYIPEPESIYKAVFKLPAGHSLTLQCNEKTLTNAKPTPYWSIFDSANTHDYNEQNAKETLKNLLRKSVKRCMLADVPLGAFLSGGTDSSLITALMQEQSTQKVRTFTMGFDDPKFDESPHARDIATHLGTDHAQMIVRGRDVLDVIPQLPEIYDEPFADMSQIPTYLLCKLTAQNLKVALSGDAADELFAGYERYAIAQKLNIAFKYAPTPLRRALNIIDHLPAPQKVKRLAYILKAKDKREGYTRLLTSYPWTDDLVINASNTDLLFPTQTEGIDDLSAMQHFDIEHYLPSDIFTKIDRASMAVSLETRAPFLDNAVIEFAAHMPRTLKQQKGQRTNTQGKFLLKQILNDYIPRSLTERPKKGFDLPLAHLLRHDLKEWAQNLINDTAQNDLLNTTKINAIWENHLAQRGDYHYLIWNILMLQQWLNR